LLATAACLLPPTATACYTCCRRLLCNPYGAMHQNQIQLRVKFWCIPRSTAQCGIYSPIRQGGTPKGPTLTNEPAPSGRGAHPKGHYPSTLTNEPATSGRGAHPKGHRPSTLTYEPAPSGRGHTQQAIVLSLSHTNLPHWAGGLTQRAIVLPLSQTNLPHQVGGRVARGDLGISSGARRRWVNRCPPETPRKKEKADILKQTNKRCGCNNKQTNPKKKNESRGYPPPINLKSKPLPFRNQNVMADSNHDPLD